MTEHVPTKPARDSPGAPRCPARREHARARGSDAGTGRQDRTGRRRRRAEGRDAACDRRCSALTGRRSGKRSSATPRARTRARPTGGPWTISAPGSSSMISRRANLTPRLADDFIRDLRAMSGRDADSMRLVVSACSSFFTFLERRFDEIRNPFRGSRARPASTWTEAVIPTAAELEILQAEPSPHSPRPWRWPSKRGCASGGCQGSTSGRTEPGTLFRRRTAFTPLSRSPLASAALKVAHLDPRRPFAPKSFPRGPGRADGGTKGSRGGAPHRLAEDAARSALRAARAGRKALRCLLLARSPPCVRASGTPAAGLVWLRDRLGHSSVSVTERYLRNVLHADTGKM